MNFDFVKQLLPGAVRLILLLVLFVIMPVKSLISINLLTLCWVFVYKLHQEIVSDIKPLPKEYFWTFLKTLIFTNLFLALWAVAGLLGIIGFITVSIILALVSIYRGRDLFNQYTSWAANRLWGRTKEDFKYRKGETIGSRSQDKKDN